MEHAVANSYDAIHNNLTVLCKKSKIVSFGSSIMEILLCFYKWKIISLVTSSLSLSLNDKTKSLFTP